MLVKFMKLRSTVRLVALVMFAGLFSGCHKPQAPAAFVAKVTVAQPRMVTVTNWDEYPGHIEAVEMVEVRPRVSGYIESIHFEDGAEVKAGDLLFVIDPKPYQADLDRARAERQRAESRLELAKNDLQRAENLKGTRAISEEEYDSRSKAAREAEAALLASKAAEATAQLNLDYTRVKSPINGRIGRRLVTAGNLVQGGGAAPATMLATLVSVDPIYCYFDTDEQAFVKYRVINKAGAGKENALACELALADEESFPHQGHIDFYDNQVNSKTGTIRMRGAFANGDRALVPGMFAKARIPAGPPTRALVIPAVAIGSDQGQKYVLVVNKESVVEARPIQADRQHGAMRAVTGGLSVEDRVIINGLLMARAGAKVEVVDAPPKEGAPARQAQR